MSLAETLAELIARGPGLRLRVGVFVSVVTVGWTGAGVPHRVRVTLDGVNLDVASTVEPVTPTAARTAWAVGTKVALLVSDEMTLCIGGVAP